MFKLRITFRGQCAFAPKADGTEAKVFLPEEGRVHESRPGVGLIPHHAAVTVRARHLFSGGVKVPGRLVWFLNHNRIRIVPQPNDVEPKPLNIEGFDHLATPKEPSLVRRPQIDDRGFWWLAHIEKACLSRHLQVGGGIVDRCFLKPKLSKADAKLLAARVEVSTGVLRVGEFLKSGNKFIVWRFKSFDGISAGSDHFQILAGTMLLEQEIVGDYVTIEGVPLADPDAGEKTELVLYPKDDGDGPIVELEILNEEGDQFMPDPVAFPATLKIAHDKDRVFESMYQFVKNPPPPDEFPIPVADYFVLEEDAADEPAQSAPPCSPSRFEPYS